MQEIARWLVLYLSVLTGLEADDVDPDAPLGDFDLDSHDAVEMAFQFESAFAADVPPETFLRGDRSIAAIAADLAASVGAAERA